MNWQLQDADRTLATWADSLKHLQGTLEQFAQVSEALVMVDAARQL
jgi:hypothetical protein